MQCRPSPYRWAVLGLLSYSYLLVYVHRMCPAVLAGDIMRDFGASGAVTGLMASAYFYPYALMQIPGGLLTDRLGSRRLVTLCMLVATAGSILFAFSSSVDSAFWARVIVGLGVSVVLVPACKALTTWFPAKDYMLGTSVIISVAGLGGVVAGSPLAWLSLSVGWRGSFIAMGVLTLLNALMIWFMIRDKPEDMNLPPVEAPASEADQTEQSVGVFKVFGTIAASPHFWLLAFWFFINGGVLFSFAGLWAGPYFMQVYGMSKTSAGNAINLFSFGWVFGPLIFAWIANRIHSKALVLGGSMAVWCLSMIWLLLRNGTMSLPELYCWNLLFGFLGAGPAGVCFAAVKELFPIRMAGTATGMIYLFPMMGSALMQPLAGAILDRHGHLATSMERTDAAPLFWLYLGLSGLAALAGFLLNCRALRGGPHCDDFVLRRDR